ncbi:MAG TPA: YetF domain-containing protein [Pedobacter sp.]|jgi:uncharacterized membrane protein YcaP (DUF421 family)
MKEFQIYLWDFQRIFIGEVPGVFYIEIIIRSVLIYIILIASMRLMGRRMASQLSRIEMAAMVSLAAAIGVPLQSPDRGILPALVIALMVVGIERGVSYFASKNEKFEEVTQDDLDTLVQDSVLQLDRMQKTRITKDRLCAHLRSEQVTHLGTVERLYMEADGSFTLIKNPEPKPGLNILPAWDEDFVNEMKFTNVMVCKNCGNEKQQSDNMCTNCATEEWDNAVIDSVKENKKQEFAPA